MEVALSRARRRSGGGNRVGDGGFSLIEVLIAMAILLILLVGIVPVFMRSMSNTIEGREASESGIRARDETERLQSLPLDRKELNLDDGTQMKQRTEYWDASTETWATSVSSSYAKVTWGRTVTLRRFSVGDLYDEPANQIPVLDNPLDASTRDENVHLWELSIELDSERETGSIANKQFIDVTTVRSF